MLLNNETKVSSQFSFVKNLKFTFNWFPLGLQCSKILTNPIKGAATKFFAMPHRIG